MINVIAHIQKAPVGPMRRQQHYENTPMNLLIDVLKWKISFRKKEDIFVQNIPTIYVLGQR